MANTKKYVSLDKLSLYDEKIKKYLADADAQVLADSKAYSNSLSSNYDAAGSAASALADAKTYADNAANAKDAAIQAAQKAADDAAAAAGVADGKAVAAQGEVDALEAYVGTFTHDTAKSVVEYINAKTDGIATSGNLEALGTRVTTVEGKVSAIEGDYLKKADKEELAGDIADVQGAVDAEKERAEGIESGLRTDVDAIKGDYLKAADKTELQGNIDTVAGAVERLTNGVSAEEIDGVNDLIQYVKDHGTEVTGMQEDISKNAEDIAGVAERMTTAEGKITAVEGAVATKVEQSAYDTKIAALEGADSDLSGRIATLEGAIGESGSVAEDIADAKQAAIDAAAADATSKANAAQSAAEQKATELNTAMDARVQALEAIDHEHANKALLDTYDQTNADLKDAVAKKHSHSNLEVLEGITAAKVSAWDAAEQNAKDYAKTYADGLNTAMDTRVATLETWHNNFTEVSEDEINALFA